MNLTDREHDLLSALGGTVKSAISMAPVFAQVIAGLDAYNQSKFERSVKNLIGAISERVDDLQEFFSNKWITTEDGEIFVRKVIASALDEQIGEKQQLFANALINGISATDMPNIEKLKFIDILRNLSLASLMILADMHEMFKGRVRGPGRQYDQISQSPEVNPENIAQQLSHKYHPYLILSAIDEMKGQGLFSNHIEWIKTHDGAWRAGSGFATALAYTDYTCRFVEFVTSNFRSST